MFTERQSSRNYSQCEMGSLKKKFLSFTATSAASSSPSVSMMTVYSVTNGKAEAFVCAVVSCRICFDEYGVEGLYTLENCGCRFCFSVSRIMICTFWEYRLPPPAGFSFKPKQTFLC